MALLRDLAPLVNGELEGDGAVEITALKDLAAAGPGEVAFLANSGKREAVAGCGASALIVPADFESGDLPVKALLKVANPVLAATHIQNFLLTKPFRATGVNPRAVIGEDCRISREVSIGAGVVVGERVSLGERVTLAPGVVVGEDTVIGDDVTIHPNVTIYPHTLIGNRVTIHGGSVIGADGFGYATDGEGRHHKRAHLGRVRIGDDVEIGANVCVDRATFGETTIEEGAKIDNLVQVAHNVSVGKNSLLVAQAGIAGSTRLGRGVIVGGQAAVSGHLELGDGVMVAGKSGVHSSQKAGVVVAGYPAINHKKWLRACAALANLPEMVRELRELRRRLKEMEDE